jgi:hypothetical protein
MTIDKLDFQFRKNRLLKAVIHKELLDDEEIDIDVYDHEINVPYISHTELKKVNTHSENLSFNHYYEVRNTHFGYMFYGEINSRIYHQLNEKINTSYYKLKVMARIFDKKDYILENLIFKPMYDEDQEIYSFCKNIFNKTNYANKDYDQFLVFRIVEETDDLEGLRTVYCCMAKKDHSFSFHFHDYKTLSKEDWFWPSFSNTINKYIKSDIKISNMEELDFYLKIANAISY